ncbi:restriction endonuclease subunit S [Myxococcus faecalis]|uniref:restriction endonuclease subunit S n=1 Tax=Myxococcus faecalis TaxID=3115646 RepID=UPI003CEB48D1
MTTSSWPVRPLAECGRLLSGGTPSKANASYWEGRIPWYSSKELKAFELSDSELHVSSEGATNGSNLVPPGTVLFVVRGMSLANEFRVSRTLVEATFNQDVKALIPAPDLDSRYLTRCLRWLQPRVLSSTEESSHGTKRLPGQVFENLPVPVPPLPEQRRIADILDKADAIRRKRKEAIALTEELLRSAFLDMVGPAARDYSTWPVRTIESLAAEIPNAMRTGPFGSDLRHSEFVDDGIAVLGIDNAVQNRFAWGERRFITQEKYDDLRRYTVRPGDVIVTIMGTTGRSAVVPDDIPTAITTKHLATITLDRKQAEPEFVSQALFRHPEVLQQIAAANRGAIMSGLNLGLIKALRIPVPPIERQREFARVTLRGRAVTARMTTDTETEDLFNTLVARAFSGNLS